jgi:type II secretory ATPase GspE/PulE/Tfp pilus assembly ATPase PilB-like protein
VAKKNGMISLWNVGKTYVLQGITSIEELMGLYME